MSGEPRRLSTLWLQTCSCIYSKRPLTKNVRNSPRSGKWLKPRCALKVNDRYLYWHDCWNDLLQGSACWGRNQQKYFGVILRDAGDIIAFEGCVMHIQCQYCVSVLCGCNVCVLWGACGDVSIVLESSVVIAASVSSEAQGCHTVASVITIDKPPTLWDCVSKLVRLSPSLYVT